MTNEAALLVIAAIWLFSGRGLNLCSVIIAYYVTFLLFDCTEMSGFFSVDLDTAIASYAIQVSIDSLALTAALYLSTIHKKFISLYIAYGAIIASSLILNGLMLYDQVIDLSIVYQLHAIRQEFSIPLDVLFAVLGSAAGGQAYIAHNLRTANGAVYNRSNIDN